MKNIKDYNLEDLKNKTKELIKIIKASEANK